MYKILCVSHFRNVINLCACANDVITILRLCAYMWPWAFTLHMLSIPHIIVCILWGTQWHPKKVKVKGLSDLSPYGKESKVKETIWKKMLKYHSEIPGLESQHIHIWPCLLSRSLVHTLQRFLTSPACDTQGVTQHVVLPFMHMSCMRPHLSLVKGTIYSTIQTLIDTIFSTFQIKLWLHPHARLNSEYLNSISDL